MPHDNAPALHAVLYRVSDVASAATFFREALGCPTAPGPRPGWFTVDVGGHQSFWLAPGGHDVPPLRDRWEQRGVIPILRTFAVDNEKRNLDRHQVAWINEPFDYDMKGHGRLAYFMGPGNQPVGIQQRMADSQREEDLTVDSLMRGLVEKPRWLGIGWLIYQADDIVGVRDFIQQAFGWPELRGTEGFGYMLQIAPTVMLQIAFKGQREDPARNLESAPLLPVLAMNDVAALQRSVQAHGGSVGQGFDGFGAIADPEGHAWLTVSDK